MKLTAKDAFEMYKTKPKVIAKRYIEEYLNLAIKQQSPNFKQSRFVGLMNNKTGDISFFFQTEYSHTRINFDVTELIFNELKKHGYDIHSDFKITTDNKYKETFYLGEIEIDWSKADEKKILLQLNEIKMMTAKQAFDNFNDKLLQRDQYIAEVIVPMIEEAASEKTFIELPSLNLWYIGDSLEFSKEYNKYGYDIELTNLILDELQKNGFDCQFEFDTYGTERCNGVGKLIIRWDNQ